MRKELLVYVPTFEKGTEISVTSVSNDRSFVIINTPNGKVTANREELVLALLALEEFDKEHNSILVEAKVLPISILEDVTYGDEG